jgi:transcriptional regulator with XRE-family HTH domain
MISAKQIRAARVFLDWEQKDLAEQSGLSLPTIQRMEKLGVERSTAGNAEKVQHALEAAGVRFTEDGGVSPAPATSSAAQFDVCEQKDGRWQVIVSLPGRLPMNVSDFDGEAAAKSWVQQDAAAWLSKLSN